MESTTKTKLCWNCDGVVALEEENCIYCGVYLGPASISNPEEKSSILPPPYKIPENEEGAPKSPYDIKTPLKQKPQEQTSEHYDEVEGVGQSDLKKVVLPMSLLLSGSVFSLFGIVLWLFSSEGIFTLQWNSTYWYVYLTLAVPMLYFGWRALEAVDNPDDE